MEGNDENALPKLPKQRLHSQEASALVIANDLVQIKEDKITDYKPQALN